MNQVQKRLGLSPSGILFLGEVEGMVVGSSAGSPYHVSLGVFGSFIQPLTWDFFGRRKYPKKIPHIFVSAFSLLCSCLSLDKMDLFHL